MKRIIKNPIFTFILGALIFGSIGVVSAYTIFANDIGYTPKDTTWKKSNGEDITNVKDAIDELYNKTNNSNLVLGQASYETYRGDRQNIAVTKKVGSGKYLVAISRTMAGLDSTSFSFDVEESNDPGTYELVCDKNCNIKEISKKFIANTASSKGADNMYKFYRNFLALYEVTVEENDTSITYNYIVSSNSAYALGCILETIPYN